MLYTEKQVHIIEAAEALFAANGYGSTSVRQIADHAGVNLAMISYYFGSKEQLLHALVDLRTTQSRLRLESLFSDTTLTPIQKIDMLVHEYVEKFVERHCFYKIMLTEHMLDKNNEISKILLEVKRRNAEILTRIIAEGQKKKMFKKNIDVVLMMNVLVGTLNHSLLNKEFYREFHHLQKMKEDAFTELLSKKLSEEIKNIFKALLIYEA